MMSTNLMNGTLSNKKGNPRQRRTVPSNRCAMHLMLFLVLVAPFLLPTPSDAQQCSSLSYVCRREGEDCDNIPPGSAIFCATGTYCSGINCVRLTRLSWCSVNYHTDTAAALVLT